MHYQTTSDPKNRKVSKGLAKRKCFKVILRNHSIHANVET